jgi:hypothetical protein
LEVWEQSSAGGLKRNNSLSRRSFCVWGKNARRNIMALSTLLLVFGLLITLSGVTLVIKETPDKDDRQVYVGIDVAFDDEETVYKVADAVKGYVNLIILGSLNVTTETAKLTRVCDYLYQQGFYFIIFIGFTVNATQPPYLPPQGPGANFFIEGMARWGDKLLGAYVFDEAGGKLIDEAHSVNVTGANDYSGAAILYIHDLKNNLGNISDYYKVSEFGLFTSDYALYWYDYLSGYDVVFGEFVGNQSRQLTVALCRGAAKSLGKTWGIMITWKYMQPPYVEEPLQLLRDMMLAYRNGAKYIVVFDSPANNSAATDYGILTRTHLDVIKLFWYYTKLTPTPEEFSAETAYVLPSDYGYGFRGSADRIWGGFGPDALSPVIWNGANSLIRTYGIGLDIVYETKTDSVPVTLSYEKLIYWNDTIIER